MLRAYRASRALHTTAALRARILAADPIDAICGQILRERGHEVVEAAKTTFPVSELMATIGGFDGLVVRVRVLLRLRSTAHRSLYS